MSLRDDIKAAINANSAENASNTPDFILATFLDDCLDAFDGAVNTREKWHGRPAADEDRNALEAIEDERRERDDD